MASTSPELFVEKIKSILEANGITDLVSEVILADTGLQGENFSSQIKYVTVKFEEQMSSRKGLNLFVKIPTLNLSYNQVIQDWQFFEKETEFFMEYLPKAREYCKLMGVEELMDIYPKCYYSDDELMVFENLVLERGFILLDKKDKHDFETAKLALSNLTIHHAISHALIEEHGGAEKFFERFPNSKFEYLAHESTRAVYGPGFDNTINTVINILDKCEGMEGREKAIEMFKGKKGKQPDEVLNSLKEYPGEFLVLNHGDYWNNNMMFLKDKETNKLTHHIAIDFQGTRYASPCSDLGYYLFMSVKAEVRRGRFQELLGTYLEALKTAGNKLGHDIQLSLEELVADFGKHFHFGFWVGLDVVTEAGYEVLKDMEIREAEDVLEWIKRWSQMIGKWMDEHPEQCSKSGQEIIQYYKEYEAFNSGGA